LTRWFSHGETEYRSDRRLVDRLNDDDLEVIDCIIANEISDG